MREPPKRHKPSHTLRRIFNLALLAILGGVIVWGVVTSERIDQVEVVDHASLELLEPMTAGGLTINVVEHRGGPIPVVFLHDADLAGGAVFDEAIAGLPARFRGVVIDLPGFGLSERIPGESSLHTVAGLADVVREVIEERVPISAVLVGVGLGGEVAAEIAVRHPDLVRGLVMVDVDFWASRTWLQVGEGLPFLDRPLAFTFEGGGLLGERYWSPNCGSGGWCPTEDQLAARALAITVQGSTDSLLGFRATLPSSLVPSSLDQLATTAVYVWSTRGSVTRESVDRVASEIEGLQILESEAWMAHVDIPPVIGEAVAVVSP